MLAMNEQSKPEPMAYSIADTAWILGKISQNHVRNLIRDRVLDTVRIGRRVMVTAPSIKRLAQAETNPEQEAA
jgi:hypothetical protein